MVYAYWGMLEGGGFILSPPKFDIFNFLLYNWISRKGDTMSKKTKALLESYARSVLAGAASLYLAGVTEPKDLVWSLIAAVAPVALRYINPNDPAFGRLPSAEEVDVAAKKAVAKKAPAEKVATAKRTKVK